MIHGVLSSAEKAQVIAMRKEGLLFVVIANRLHVKRNIVVGVWHRHQKGLSNKKAQKYSAEIRASMIAALAAVPKEDHRTITGRICGDPLPERSALYRRDHADNSCNTVTIVSLDYGSDSSGNCFTGRSVGEDH